jgi:mRNA interferase YafQ
MKLCEKQGKDLTKIKAVMFDLIVGNPLPPKNKDHMMVGNFKGHRNCHVEPDWILLYLYDGDEVRFVRTGSHSELLE